MEDDRSSQADIIPNQNRDALLTWLIPGLACLLILLGIVCTIAATVSEPNSQTDDKVAKDIANACPAGHTLTEFHTPNPSYFCDVCGDSQRTLARMFGCRICNWDKCHRCSRTH